MAALTLDDFPEFFRQVHQPCSAPEPGADLTNGPQPFPWQIRLLQQVARGGWPELIDVPTGLGKTAIIDVAVFAAALADVRSPRRVFFVVDRRLVVDEAHEHALSVSRALAEAAPSSVAGRVAAELRLPGDDGPALEVTRMRGGVTWSWRWLERPDRRAVITGTVDQIGSRLFFRGYTVGDNLRPIDAALAGTDSLIVIDEAHLSESFVLSARAAFDLDVTPAAVRPVIVAMSASPGLPAASVFAIGAKEDHDAEAARRLHAPKRLWLADVPASRRSVTEKMADAHAAWAGQLADDGSVVGVIVNTVGRARAVFERLNAVHPGRCVLLTGRVRPVDREYLLDEWYGRVRAGRARVPGAPLFVVATQTIEVGANIDLDVLVTETASLPALQQRLGRLNRLGAIAAPSFTPAIVLHADADADGIYGPARTALRTWLGGHAQPLNHPVPAARLQRSDGLDVSPAALRQLTQAIGPQAAAELREPKPYTPVMFPSVLDAWASTSPVPHPDIPVDPFLHGIDRDPAQVTVLWRDLPNNTQKWQAAVGLLPPAAEECVEIPVSAARRWLTQTGHADDIADLDTGPAPPATAPTADQPGRQVLRYRSREDSAVIPASQIQPGDLIIVPAVTGGCDKYGWNPESGKAVLDVADLASGSGRPLAAVRFHPQLIAAIRSHDTKLASRLDVLAAQIRQDLADSTADPKSYATEIAHAIAATADAVARPLPHLAVLHRLADAGRRLRVTISADTDDPQDIGVILLAAGADSYREDDTAVGSSLARKRISLRAHHKAVHARAEEFAARLGLDPQVAESVAVAAGWHDEGKRDLRFQVLLHGGDRCEAEAADEPLAKSGMDPADVTAQRQARDRARYPDGLRHEALSAQIARQLLANPGLDVDSDLVLHLIASHHGRSRPLLPPITDPEPCRSIQRDTITLAVDTSQTVDWTAPARFATLNQRYGRWGLARLEAIVRLADIWC